MLQSCCLNPFLSLPVQSSLFTSRVHHCCPTTRRAVPEKTPPPLVYVTPLFQQPTNFLCPSPRHALPIRVSRARLRSEFAAGVTSSLGNGSPARRVSSLSVGPSWLFLPSFCSTPHFITVDSSTWILPAWFCSVAASETAIVMLTPVSVPQCLMRGIMWQLQNDSE